MLFRMYNRWAERHGYACKQGHQIVPLGPPPVLAVDFVPELLDPLLM